MRIIPDYLIIESNHKGDRYNEIFAFGAQSTIDKSIEITDREWDEIENAYWEYREGHDYRATFPAMPFSQYLRVIIELARTK